jgi:DNA polymerase-3 subunit delta
MIYAFYGDNEYAIRQDVDKLKAGLGDPATADLNTTVLDGRSLSVDELRLAASAMPFLAPSRLVIVEGALARFEPRPGAAESSKGRPDPLEAGLRAYLPTLPDSAILVFVERGPLSAGNAVLRLLREVKATVREHQPLTGPALSEWIMKEVRRVGADMSPRAAETLGAFVGGNLRQLAQEIAKLASYAGKRRIEDGDVQLMVADAREIKVWALTDALAARNRDTAIGALHQMLDDGEAPPMLLAVIARQFRSLVAIKEMADERLSPEAIAGQMKLHPYVVQKSLASARGFSYERLDAIYHRLLETDLAIKTGRLEPDLALDLLVLDLTSA